MKTPVIIASGTVLGDAFPKGEFSIMSTPETISEMFPKLRDLIDTMMENSFCLDYDDIVELRKDDTIPPELAYWLDPDTIVHCH